MPTTRPFRVLYREFLFRIVDRELLSTHAKGDASQLLLQIVALLAFLSVCFAVLGLGFDQHAPAHARLLSAWNFEHFLIATSMLAVGLFAVMSWGSMFPDHRDVLVLAPLPIRAHTILLAKLAAVVTALGLVVFTLNVASGFVWPFVLSGASPAAWIRLFAAYWLTMMAAGIFVFGVVMGAQGIAAALLPYRYFRRVSSFLQLAAFCIIVAGYFLQPMRVTSATLLAAQQRGPFGSSPSYWFLGLFQTLAGSADLAPLTQRARAGVAVAILGTMIAYAWSYVRTLQRIVEEPGIAPDPHHVAWLPAFGNALQTAIVQFSVRTLFRSAQHRVVLAFYWGIAFAVAVMFFETPRGQQLAAGAATGRWQDASVPLLVGSLALAGFAVLAARMAFALPLDLPANWIFRVMPVRGGLAYTAARRRAFVVVGALPACVASALVLFWQWPWQPAVEHLVALALLSLIFVELCLHGTQKIPFTCSYLPGKSRVHIVVFVVVILLFPLTIMAATFERDALQQAGSYATMLGVLTLIWLGARWRTARMAIAEGAQPEFEDEPPGRVLTLELWESRFKAEAHSSTIDA
jgi:hypothetical protein